MASLDFFSAPAREWFADTTYGQWLHAEGVAVFEDWAVPIHR